MYHSPDAVRVGTLLKAMLSTLKEEMHWEYSSYSVITCLISQLNHPSNKRWRPLTLHRGILCVRKGSGIQHSSSSRCDESTGLRSGRHSCAVEMTGGYGRHLSHSSMQIWGNGSPVRPMVTERSRHVPQADQIQCKISRRSGSALRVSWEGYPDCIS